MISAILKVDVNRGIRVLMTRPWFRRMIKTAVNIPFMSYYNKIYFPDNSNNKRLSEIYKCPSSSI